MSVVAATHCVIENCRTTVLNKPAGVSFHPCPTNNEMRKRWLKMLKSRCSMLDWYKSHICSKHFESKYFDAQRKLLSNAVPTIFGNSLPKLAPKPPAKIQMQNTYSTFQAAKLLPRQSSPTNMQGNKKERKRTGFVSLVPWTFETEPRHGMDYPRSKVDRLLNKLTQAELTANIKASMSRLKEPADLDAFVTDDLRCRPDAPKEAVLWLMVKKQDHLNNRLMELVVQTKKHVEILHNKSEESNNSKRDNEQTIESLKYIVKCLQEKHATLEEQIEILTSVESR
ncbi:hypothetical protein PYW07_005221 [Mythimna separata]|uniref:THAP-type domain-containing protein n=1 Tax=Mythimna separata TaxID=271217 RepID=A0AAD7YDZ4_MYTSE|nr:hypothetical protein PYW07_005221 [Mythimna separata]